MARSSSDAWGVEYLQVHSDTLQAVLTRARQLLDWEGESIVPGGPDVALVDYMAGHREAAGADVLALLQFYRRIYGAGVARVRRQVERYVRAVAAFVDAFGPGEVIVGRAPARINILGEHVDYVRYLPTEVLPFASREHDMLMLFRATEGRTVRGRSTLDDAEPETFDLVEGPQGREDPDRTVEEAWLAYLHEVGTPPRSWVNYAKGAVFFCAMKHGALARGFDFLLDSTIPAAGGASSSSTIVVLGGAAARIANAIAFDEATLADDSSKAEWYIGTRGGNMDHGAMCLSRRQHALRLLFSPFRVIQVPLHRFRYRWVTFFTHPADKSGDVLLQYNERSAVSRLLIPLFLERMLQADPERLARWDEAVETLRQDTDDIAAARTAREILESLPEETTLAEVRALDASVHEELRRGYPALVEAWGDRPLKVRSRALHHVGEIIRVRQVANILREVFSPGQPEAPEKTEPGLRAVGELITETHDSMRDLYELTTPDIEELVDLVLSHPGVYGARLMGGGFGGNVVALTSKEDLAELVDRVQERYYAPRDRDGVAEGSVMVSTPGEGFCMLSLRDVLRRTVVSAGAVWWKWDRYEPVVDKCVKALLNVRAFAEFTPRRPIQPVIVAGGRGKLDLSSDYRSPSALTILNGLTSLEHVMSALQRMPFETRPPILIVSPAMLDGALDGLRLPEGTKLVTQPAPLGTGNAVLAGLDALPDEEADVIVVWGAQPLLSSETLARSVIFHQALGSEAMLFPTAVTRRPYAPIRRDLRGYVKASLETAHEGAPSPRLGETNVGAFVLDSRLLVETLTRLHTELWDDAARRYATRSGDLGFPNEMARALVQAGERVLAFPIANVEESFGLRDQEGYEQIKRIVEGRG